MDNPWQQFILTFVPLFIVIDAIGILPFIIPITQEMTKRERWKMINVAIITATAVGLIFLFFGQLLLQVLDISVGAFAIAGGIILMLFSIKYMMTGHMIEVVKEEMVAVVPVGTPLTAGPATITTLLLLVMQFPLYIVLISFALNMFIAWGILIAGNQFTRFLGKGGLKAFSKIFSLLLSAIAVNMVINGLEMLDIL